LGLFCCVETQGFNILSFPMSRALRPRKSQPSYAALFALENGDEDEDGQPKAGPSKKALLLDEADSGSDFSPDRDAEMEHEPPEDELSASGNDQSPLLEDDLNLADEEPLPVIKAGPSKAKPNPKAKGKSQAKKVAAEVIMPSLGSGAGIARTSKRQIYVLPTPSVHHRHRAVPLYARAGRIERLAVKPPLFGPAAMTGTNNFTHNPAVTNRVNKGWGFNVGSGPLWDLVEDRGWYKEALVTSDDLQIEANRRPVTHPGLRVKPGWEVMSAEYEISESSKYLFLTLRYLVKPLPTYPLTPSRRRKEI
jgi:transcription factor C subunit 6